MLDILCGSRAMQKVLLFLHVNGKCYGTQLSRLMNSSLTPLQNALQRLERGGVISSSFEGKTRVYYFNPAYPLKDELDSLLKKAYSLLPSEERLPFVYGNGETLSLCWNRLKQIRHLRYVAKAQIGWERKGNGVVQVNAESSSSIIFSEKGVWEGLNNEEIAFSNIYRWSLRLEEGVISLEHLRHGWNHPVFLFHLQPAGKDSLKSVNPHVCLEDSYFGRIFFNERFVHLNWRVMGPKKNEEIDYYYS